MTDRMVIKRINLNSEKLKIKTKLAFGIGATGEGAANWIFAGLTFFFYNQVLNLSGTLTGLAVLIAIIFETDPKDVAIHPNTFNSVML